MVFEAQSADLDRNNTDYGASGYVIFLCQGAYLRRKKTVQVSGRRQTRV